MENMDSDEPQKKRPHLCSVSSFMSRNSNTPLENNNCVDAVILQKQNQQLVQQINMQKKALLDLEMEIKELENNQNSYDDMLIAINGLWNQLVDDLVLLGIRAGGGQSALEALKLGDESPGLLPSCPVEDIFLCRLIQKDYNEVDKNVGIIDTVEKALAFRHSSCLELMKFVEDAIEAEREKTEEIFQAFGGKLSSEDIVILLSKIDVLMEEEAKNLHEIIDALHKKHKEYVNCIQSYCDIHLKDECEIKSLADELDERMTELEESRRRLVTLKMEKDIVVGMHSPTSDAVNGNMSPEKPSDKIIGLCDLKDSIDEAKILASDRLSELEEIREDNLVFSKELQDLQNELRDDKYVHSSRLYNLLNDQLQHWSAELERYRMLTESLQVEKPHISRWEKELTTKLELVDAAISKIGTSDSTIEELELRLQKCIIERNDLEIKMEEAVQDSARRDIKSEFQVMGSALSREMGMMEAQLKRWKDAAHEAVSLREKVDSMRTLLSQKTDEQRSLSDKIAEQMVEIKSLKALIERLKKEKLETEICLDMHGQETYEKRDLTDIRESERRALSRVQVLKNALDEHSLELRVKAANEAEAACQQRLTAAEAEIVDLRTKLDASERDILELREAIKVKDAEAEAYISEIETISQAYEDMQTQNQHLLQQVTERDDYNIKLVSESVKTRQARGNLLSEKQVLAKQLQQVNASTETLRSRIANSEEQMKAIMAEAFRCTQEEKHVAVTLESTKWELADVEKELKWLKPAVSSSEKEYDQIQQDIGATKLELDTERNARRKLEEELEELNTKIEELSSETGETAIQRLQDEIRTCKNMIKCTVCFDRPKEVVIVKCFHLFCNQCIQRNLELRHRKCPACGTAFGQNDVRFVKI